jgi:hypothetical protein
VIAAGCDYIQFDEPMCPESREDSPWAAEILNEPIESLPRVRFGLHVCGGTPGRKRSSPRRLTKRFSPMVLESNCTKTLCNWPFGANFEREADSPKLLKTLKTQGKGWFDWSARTRLQGRSTVWK